MLPLRPINFTATCPHQYAFACATAAGCTLMAGFEAAKAEACYHIMCLTEPSVSLVSWMSLGESSDCMMEGFEFAVAAGLREKTHSGRPGSGLTRPGAWSAVPSLSSLRSFCPKWYLRLQGCMSLTPSQLATCTVTALAMSAHLQACNNASLKITRRV